MNPYRRDDLRAAWSAGRRAFKNREARGYDELAYKRGFWSIDKERREAEVDRWRLARGLPDPFNAEQVAAYKEGRLGELLGRSPDISDTVIANQPRGER